MPKRIRFLIVVAVLLLISGAHVMGGMEYVYAHNTLENTVGDTTQTTTVYSVQVIDGANLLTDEQESLLAGKMQGVAQYCNVLFVSSDQVSGTTADYAAAIYREQYGDQSGVLFFIDMSNREIYVYAHGTIYATINRSNAYTITDNVYTYASAGDYYSCAFQAFSQIQMLIEGEKINRPMKHISNLLLAVIFSVLFNYWLMRMTSKVKELDKENLLKGNAYTLHIQEPKYQLLAHKRYSRSSSSGGSSGGGGGGSSGGGGGGHSF